MAKSNRVSTTSGECSVSKKEDKTTYSETVENDKFVAAEDNAVIALDYVFAHLLHNSTSRKFASGLKGSAPILEGFILTLICIVTFMVRQFAVIRYESVIHEYDPHFNLRATKLLAEKGFYEFWNWFDDRTWYPLGRVVGQTLYPGLMVTSNVIYKLLNYISLTISIKDVCVFLAPFFACLSALVTYLLVKEIYAEFSALSVSGRECAAPLENNSDPYSDANNDYVGTSGTPEAGSTSIGSGLQPIKESNRSNNDKKPDDDCSKVYEGTPCEGGGAGLLSALFLGLCPAYLSRSVAGSYDNEAVAIFALIFAFYVCILALKSGSMLTSMLAAFAYFYMVVSWGGYVFIINTLSLYIIAMIILDRLTHRHHIAYTTFYVISTVLCLNVPIVGFAAITSSEHMISHGVFCVLHALFFVRQARATLPKRSLMILTRVGLVLVIVILVAIFSWLSLTGRTSWSSRSMTLLDPSYAAKYIPIVASVSEHQPTVWSGYFFDLHICAALTPLGLWVCFKRSTDGLFFVGLYGMLAVYFSGIMVRLMLVLAPAACILSGIGLSFVISSFVPYLKAPYQLQDTTQVYPRDARAADQMDALEEKYKVEETSKIEETCKIQNNKPKVSLSLALFALIILAWVCILYVVHCTWVSSKAYSHPSIVISVQNKDGTRIIQDDFREAYYWLRHNTPYESRVMSWWDYGYQATYMADRTVIVDNNTWNNHHIATVGLAFASSEEEAYRICRRLDVDYIFITFGGFARYNSDDINKFLWMVRIASGVYPHIQQSTFLASNGQYTVGKNAPPALLNSLLYKLIYYRFAELTGGHDYARNTQIAESDIHLQHFEEVYTTQNWIGRVYKVKDPPNRSGKVRGRFVLT